MMEDHSDPDGVLVARLRNARTSISLLPVEILQSIFETVASVLLGPVPNHEMYLDGRQAVKTLLSVCYSWYNVVLATPTLWSTIKIVFVGSRSFEYDAAERQNLLQLERSGSAPLHVHLTIRMRGESNFTRFIPQLHPHLGRCRALRLDGDDDHLARCMAKLVGEGILMEELEELELIGDPPNRTSTEMSAPSNSLQQLKFGSRLQRLILISSRFYDNTLSWRIPITSSLSTLRSVQFLETVGSNDMLDVLSHCAGTLVNVFWTAEMRPGVTFDPSPNHVRIVLPALITLRLVGEDAIGCLHLIEAPHLTHLRADASRWEASQLHAPTTISARRRDAAIRRWLLPDSTRAYVSFPNLRWACLPIPSDFIAEELEQFVLAHATLTYLDLLNLQLSNVKGIQALSRLLVVDHNPSLPQIPQEIRLVVRRWSTSQLPESELSATVHSLLTSAGNSNLLPIHIRVIGWGVSVLGDINSSSLRKLATAYPTSLSLSITASSPTFNDH